MDADSHKENGTEDRERIYRSFDYGNLANLMMLVTRLIGRDQQIDQVQLLLANHDETAFIDNGTPVNPYDNFGAFAMGVGNLVCATQFGQVQQQKPLSMQLSMIPAVACWVPPKKSGSLVKLPTPLPMVKLGKYSVSK